MSIPALVVLTVLPLMAVIAAVKDLTTMTIPNWITLVLIAAFVPAALIAGLGWADIGWHLLAGVVALLAGMGMFALRWLGGGDAKIMAALILWLGPAAVLPFLLWTAIAGGALALILLTARSRLPALAGIGPAWVGRLMEPKGDIPYGVAICLGALKAWPISGLFVVALAG